MNLFPVNLSQSVFWWNNSSTQQEKGIKEKLILLNSQKCLNKDKKIKQGYDTSDI